MDTETIRFKRDPSTKDAIVERETHWQTLVLKGAGLQSPSVSYSRTFSKFSKLEGRVVLPDGTSRLPCPPAPPRPARLPQRTRG